jgi:hypothetical protein
MPKKRVVRRRRTPTTGGIGHHWSRLPRWVRIAAAWGSVVGVVAGAIVSANKSWEYIEPWWYVSHAYLHNDYTDTTIKPVKSSIDTVAGKLSDIQYDAAKGKREATVNDIAKWQLELNKPDNNETARNLINERLRNLTDTRESLDRQIRSIERARAQEH